MNAHSFQTDRARTLQQDVYNRLSDKTLMLFSEFSAAYPAFFYIKADDDIYLNLGELAAMLQRKQEAESKPLYVGCMKSGIVINDRK